MEPSALIIQAFHDDNAAEVARLLEAHPSLRENISEPSGAFGTPAIVRVKSRQMLDVLLTAGADINSRSNWWAGGFGLLDTAEPSLATYAIERGAIVTPHAAARLGMLGELERIVAAKPGAVHERGGDGQMPLHFAASVEIARFLLDHGADIDARDVDHVSTAAQWMLDKREDVARYLVARGCWTDILMAAALGDEALVRKHLEADPESIRKRVSDEWFPMVGGPNGGTIYQWHLGWYVSAVEVARRRGHGALVDLLMAASPAEEQLLNACWLGDDALVARLLSTTPNLAERLPASGRRHAAHAARDNDTRALRLLLAAGLPVSAAEARTQHRGTALHWAAWFGNLEAVTLILAHHPSLDDAENDYHATPLGWARHGQENCWCREKGNYPAVIELLMKSGAAA